MLGKLPCVPRTASCRSLLIPCEDSDGDAAGFTNGAQVTALWSPCKVVIGFDVEAEKQHLANVCESPRSVLESSAAWSSQEKQQVAAPSPRSGLWSLLAAKTGSDEDAIPPSPEAPNVSIQACDCGHGKAVVCVCKEASILHTENLHLHCDLSDNVCECNKQGLHLASQEHLTNEVFDVNIFPTRTEGSSLRLNALEEAKSCLKTSPPPQISNFLVSDSVKIDNEVTDAPLECKCGHGSPNTNLPTRALADPVRKDLYAPNWTSRENSVGKDSCNADLDPRHVFRYSDIDVGYDIRDPVFVASSPYSPKSFEMPASGFLKICNYCGCFLNLGKDIFMYRGDQTFCSAECRYQKIALHEREFKKL